MISIQEIANITGNKNWKRTDVDTKFYFDSKNTTQVANSTVKSKYYWLYDYLKDCSMYGCKTSKYSDDWGYWVYVMLMI